MSIRKKILPLFLTGVMTISLTGCDVVSDIVRSLRGPEKRSQAEEDPEGAAKGDGTETGDDGGENTVITFMSSQDWVTDAEMEVGSRFEEETGIHVEYQIVPSDQYQEILLSSLNGGEGPDIWAAQSGFALATTYAVSENAVDLSGEDWIGAYDKFSAAQTSVGGVNYGMTYFDTTTDYYMVYNKKIFEEAGAEVPTTWKEFISCCDRIAKKGVTPIYEPVADGWHVLMLWAENGQVFDKLEPGIIDRLNNNEATFSGNENMKQAVNQLNELAAKGYFGEDYMSDEYIGAADKLSSGEAAMCMLKPGAIKAIVDSDMNTKGYKEEDFGLFILPIVDNQYLNIHPTGPSRFVYSQSGNIEAAKKHLSYIARKENVQYVIDNAAVVENLPLRVGQVPEYSKVTRDFLAGFDDTHSGMVLQDEVLYFNEQWMEINADLAAMFAGDMTAEDVLRGIDERRTQLAQAAGDPNWE